MKIKNAITCDHCKTENEYYREKCKNCKSYLRARVFNIDLWSTIWHLFETPGKSFTNIVYAENKNYAFILLLVLGFKYFLNTIVIANVFIIKDVNAQFTFWKFLPFIGIFIGAFIVLNLFLTLLMNLIGYKNRFKSVASVLVYAFIPMLFVLIIFTPVEFALFGESWFFSNPSPYFIKPTASIVLYGIEILGYLWCFILCIRGFHILTRSKIAAVVFSLIYISIFTAGMYYMHLI